MPTLFSFGPYRVRIYFREHGIPHVHLISADHAVVIAIEDGEIIEGSAPADALATARVWIAENQTMLLAMWRK